MLVNLTTYALSAKSTESVGCSKSFMKKVELVETMTVRFIQVVRTVTVRLCASKIELKGTLLIQIVSSELV